MTQRSMRAALAALALAANALVLAACGNHEPVYLVQDHPIPPAVGRKMGDERIGNLIADLATRLDWDVTRIGPGHHQISRKFSGSHTVTVSDVYFSKQNYSIVLLTSSNLKQDDVEVDPHYNQAVRQLENDVERAIFRAAN